MNNSKNSHVLVPVGKLKIICTNIFKYILPNILFSFFFISCDIYIHIPVPISTLLLRLIIPHSFLHYTYSK